MHSDWVDLCPAGLGIRLRYPAAAPDGEHVEMDDFRAHFRTMTSAQVYFEVSRHTGISASDLYERETAASGAAIQASESPT